MLLEVPVCWEVREEDSRRWLGIPYRWDNVSKSEYGNYRYFPNLGSFSYIYFLLGYQAFYYMHAIIEGHIFMMFIAMKQIISSSC